MSTLDGAVVCRNIKANVANGSGFSLYPNSYTATLTEPYMLLDMKAS